MPAKRRLRFDEYRLIRRLAASGAKHQTIARALHVCLATWRAIRKRDARARAMLRLGWREFYASSLDQFDLLPGNK